MTETVTERLVLHLLLAYVLTPKLDDAVRVLTRTNMHEVLGVDPTASSGSDSDRLEQSVVASTDAVEITPVVGLAAGGYSLIGGQDEPALVTGDKAWLFSLRTGEQSSAHRSLVLGFTALILVLGYPCLSASAMRASTSASET